MKHANAWTWGNILPDRETMRRLRGIDTIITVNSCSGDYLGQIQTGIWIRQFHTRMRMAMYYVKMAREWPGLAIWCIAQSNHYRCQAHYCLAAYRASNLSPSAEIVSLRRASSRFKAA